MSTQRVLDEMNSVGENGMRSTRNGTGGAMEGGSAYNRRWREMTGKNDAALSSLLEEIRQLGFVKAELELYLDTHPTCKVAIDYYHRTTDALAALMEKYHAEGGNPLLAAGSIDGDVWKWVEMPWPWQNGRGER